MGIFPRCGTRSSELVISIWYGMVRYRPYVEISSIGSPAMYQATLVLLPVTGRAFLFLFNSLYSNPELMAGQAGYINRISFTSPISCFVSLILT